MQVWGSWETFCSHKEMMEMFKCCSDLFSIMKHLMNPFVQKGRVEVASCSSVTELKPGLGYFTASLTPWLPCVLCSPPIHCLTDGHVAVNHSCNKLISFDKLNRSWERTMSGGNCGGSAAAGRSKNILAPHLSQLNPNEFLDSVHEPIKQKK